MRVLLVEDDALLGEGIRTAMKRAGMIVDWLNDGIAAREALRAGGFDVVVLDLGLPRLDGMAVIKEARAAGSSTPILVLTARDAVSERVGALDLGADDFLGKPFSSDELLARIRALHRRSVGRIDSTIRSGSLLLDAASMSVRYNGKKIDLPRREFLVLEVLLENVGRIVSRETLQQRLYGWDEDIESNALDVHVHHLRRKLSSELIRTVRGVGYMIQDVDGGEAA